MAVHCPMRLKLAASVSRSPALSTGKRTQKRLLAGPLPLSYTLRFFRHALSRDVRKHLAETLVFPQLDYAAPVYNHLDKTRVLMLERALKACVRFVVGNISRRNHVTPHRLALGWLSALRRRQYFIGLQAFKVIASGQPLYLTDRFACRLQVDLRRSTRRPPQPFEPPPCRTDRKSVV